MKIAVVDAQGGGLGRAIVEKIKQKVPQASILALGTNVVATSAMKKSGADQAATGENAIIYNTQRVNVVIGGIGIIAANGMMGEITPKMAEAVSSSQAIKILIPMGKCHIAIPGTESYSLSELMDMAIDRIVAYSAQIAEGCEPL